MSPRTRTIARSATAPDEAFLRIEGRRWRRSDPRIPAALRQQLVNELMAARRAVATAADDSSRRDARRRVQDAKVALGERGSAWWLEPSPADLDTRIAAAIRALLRSRAEGATICPSEAARVVDGVAWRRLLPAVRLQAVRLAEAGALIVLRAGEPVTGDRTKGVLRYKLA
jgi:hypothetical protein